MRDIKEKPFVHAPRVMSNAARVPKELMRKAALQSKEQAREVAERQSPQSESPEQYATGTAEETMHRVGSEVGHQGKQLVQKANETRKQMVRHAKNTRNAQRNVRQTAETGRKTSHTVRQSADKTVKTVKASARTTVKTAKHTVKTAQHTVKATQRTVKTAAKTAQKTAQAAQKAAQAAAKAAQAAAKAAQVAAQAAAKAAVAAAKAVVAAVKAIIAALEELIAAIAAGGWVAVVAIIVIAAIALIVCSAFGVFSSNESAVDGSKPMTEAITSINNEFNAAIQSKIASLKASHNADIVELIYEGDMDEGGDVWNWADVIGVYAVKTSMGDLEEEQTEVFSVTPENIARLHTVFYDMNSVSYRTEVETETETKVDEYGAVVLDDNGEPVVTTTTTLYIYIDVSSKDYKDGASMYSFNESQNEILLEMMHPSYYPLFAELTGDILGDGGEYGFGFDINPNLLPNELGAQIVQAAKKYIGRSYASMDCSALARAALRDCGLTSMNGLSSTGMAKRCQELGILFTDPSQLQAGDLIFFARKDARRGAGYCTDTRRCGTGKCKRWQQIHHVAIYINDEFLIDSTGGKNSVQIRKHWGIKGSEWEWVGFGRILD